jgi:hypothetical protein
MPAAIKVTLTVKESRLSDRLAAEWRTARPEYAQIQAPGALPSSGD